MNKINIKTYYLNTISKFNQNLLVKQQITSNHIDIDRYFWNKIMDVNQFKNFMIKKYIPSRKQKIIEDSVFFDDFRFILQKLDYVRQKLEMSDGKVISAWDTIFSYRILNRIISYYNEYFSWSNIELSLYEWCKFIDLSMESLLSGKIELYQDSEFVKMFIIPFLEQFNLSWDIIVFQIFWPHEFLILLIIAGLLKEKWVTVIVNWAKMYEQVDLSFFKKKIESNKDIFNYFDYIIVKEDFDFTLDQLIKKIKNNGISKWVRNYFYLDRKTGNIEYDPYTKVTVDITKFDYMWPYSMLLNNKHYRGRLLPWKCYWSWCNFCIINSRSIFPYRLKWFEKYIDKLIQTIKKDNIYYISFTDDSILPKALFYFAERIIEEKLDINYILRTRFDKEYTKDKCWLLYRSWLRMIWLWLESASERVNQFVNKWYDKLALQWQESIISYFCEQWVSVHIYSILWLPSEVEEETQQTTEFLKMIIDKYDNVSCTPNSFWLKKWSNFADNPEKYWIRLLQFSEEWQQSFDKDYFHLRWKTQSYDVYKYIEDVHRHQFFQFIENISRDEILWFRKYIDYSSILYMMKRYYKIWPFKEYWTINDHIIKKSFKYIIKMKFKLSDYCQILKYKKHDEMLYVYDWVNYKEYELPKNYIRFFDEFDDNVTLWELLNRLGLLEDESIENNIILMIKNRLIIWKAY